ncbi:MAG: efflux RND transporter periplasmic adaptor subunit [Desulfarculaceae bacterium]|jgi:RND family efflux transporter MFP subunit
MKILLRTVPPLLVLSLALLGAWYVVASKPHPGKRHHKAPPPAVRVTKAVKSDQRLKVRVQGVVQPRTETQLIAEVPGKVIYMSPAMAAGGFFEAGEDLIKLDPADYEIAVVQAEGALAQAKLELAMRQAEAEAAQEDWKRLRKGKASPLVLKEPQLAEAMAAMRSAQASLKQARLNLARTVVKAPYPGRVRQEYTDVGQYVSKGFKMAEIYAVDYAEIRLPLPDEKLAFLELPMDYRNGHQSQQLPPVLIRARFGGGEYTWTGKVVRTEGELDPRSRMVIAVAQVKNPYGRGRNTGRPPLASGMFVDAEIMGKVARDVVVLPRSVLRDSNQVLVVSPDRRISFRKVTVLRLDRDQVIISQGLKENEMVCITQPEAVVENMPVQIVPKTTKAGSPDLKTSQAPAKTRPGTVRQ